MKRSAYRLIIAAATCLLATGLLFTPHLDSRANQSRNIQPSAKAVHLKVLDSTQDSILLEFTPPEIHFETSTASGQACQTVKMPGLTMLEISGQPILPIQGAMLGIPQDGKPTLEIIGIDERTIDGRFDLCPAATMKATRALGSRENQLVTTFERGSIYRVDGFTPAHSVELVSTGHLRSQRFAELRFSPLRYNAVSGEVRTTSRVVVKVTFNASIAAKKSNRLVPESDFEESLRGILINYEQAQGWRSLPIQIEKKPTTTSLVTRPAYKVMVTQDGIYQIGSADLLGAGITQDELNTLDPKTFQLFHQSSEVAILVEGQSDGFFDASDTIRFFGQKVNNKYTDTSVYWLTWGNATGLRMQNLNGTPTGTANAPDDYFTSQHIELDTDYFSDKPSGALKDHWYWTYVDASTKPGFVELKTTLRHISTLSHTATVRGLIKGYTAIPNHHTKIYLNGNLIDDHSFASGSEYLFNVSVPQSYLLEGENTLRVECPRDGSITLDQVLINWFEIDYYDTTFAENDRLVFDSDQAGTWEQRVDGFSVESLEVYDISNALAPVVISGGTVGTTANGYMLRFETTTAGEHHYLAQTTAQRKSPADIVLDSPSNWKSNSIGADYIIISYSDFINQVQALATFRANQGHRVQVVDVQDIYDEFNGGEFSPEAIKSFVAYAYANWAAPAPKYVLLVGDGHFDFKDVYGFKEPIYIPPYLDDVDPWIGETATDNRYVSVSGGDILPDLFIGRFPASNPIEAQTMVEKTINYEQNPAPGDWNTYLTFVADNPDGGGDFQIDSDQIIQDYITPSSYTVDKVYYLGNYTTSSAARVALQAAINQGRLLVHYSGHASVTTWANENLFNVGVLSILTNGNKLPFFIPMTCAEGYFIWPSGFNAPSLAESAVRINGRGAVASWSATGYGVSSGHYLLDESLFANLKALKNKLGYLTTTAKYDLYASSSDYNDLIETFTLFGDPALKLRLNVENFYLPIIQR